MDQLTNLFQNDAIGPGNTGVAGSWLGQLLSSPGLKLGLAGSGSIGNILANRSRNQVLSKEMQQMDMLNKLTPAQITSGISAIQQPLSANLQNSVANMTQGKLAERGLSQAPGIFASELGQGLAPYQLQEQQLAQDAYFKKLGLPISARPSPFGPFPQTTNTSQLWQSLMQQFMGIKLPSTPNFVPGTPKGGDQAALLQQIISGNYNPMPSAPSLGNPDWLTQMIQTGLTAPIPGTASTGSPSSDWGA